MPLSGIWIRRSFNVEAIQVLGVWGTRSLISGFIEMNMYILVLLRSENHMKYRGDLKISCCQCGYAVTNSGLQFQLGTKEQMNQMSV